MFDQLIRQACARTFHSYGSMSNEQNSFRRVSLSTKQFTQYLDCWSYFLVQEPMPKLENNVEKLEAQNTDVNKVLYWYHTVLPIQ